MEISGPAPLGTRPALAVAVQTDTAPDTRPVEPAPASVDAGAGARTDARQHSDQAAQAAASRDIRELRRAVAQGTHAAGPPPSFEVSLLEVESDLQQKLARMEAERSQARDGHAVTGAEDSRDTAPDPAPVPAGVTGDGPAPDAA
ncbi:hypothetical protein [Maritimibacter harenae]|uniref:hypothetical protein n=1 Tax=Maritimibacter harenae TaxID=2606218 RepID=UPI00136A3F6E|nr:hypothetical protein [Maritimibacter harenae]